MKKLFLFFVGAWFAAGSAQAVETSGVFSNDTFTVAAAVKIGRSAGVTSAPLYSNLGKEGSFDDDPNCIGCSTPNVCTNDSECDDDEKCSNKTCVPLCQMTCGTGEQCRKIAAHTDKCGKPCDFDNKCSSAGYRCINSGNDVICSGCLTNSDCRSGGVCLKTLNGGAGFCVYPVNLCRNRICPKGQRCSLGKCMPYPLGSTDDPQCSDTQVADGNGGCKSPCKDVICPRGKICTASAGKACCGDCTLNAVNAVRLKTLNSQLKLPASTALRWHPQLNVCLPKLEYKFVADDFKLVEKPIPYTGLVRAVELDDNLTDKSVIKLIETTPVKLDTSLTVENAVTLRSDPVLYKAVTTTDPVLTIQKTPAVTASPTLKQLQVAP